MNWPIWGFSFHTFPGRDRIELSFVFSFQSHLWNKLDHLLCPLHKFVLNAEIWFRRPNQDLKPWKGLFVFTQTRISWSRHSMSGSPIIFKLIHKYQNKINHQNYSLAFKNTNLVFGGNLTDLLFSSNWFTCWLQIAQQLILPHFLECSLNLLQRY